MAIHLCNADMCTSWRGDSYAPCNGSEVSYAGAVLETYERNGYDDSDFFAIVWDADTQRVKTVEYATTRGWTYHNGATIDATPEVIAAARARAADTWERELTRRAERERLMPREGVRVRSLMTRGKNVGVEGIVMWHGVNDFKSTRWITYYRVGVKVAGEQSLRYIDADRVEVIGAPPVDAPAVRREAEHYATGRSLRSVLECGLSGLTGPVRVECADDTRSKVTDAA